MGLVIGIISFACAVQYFNEPSDAWAYWLLWVLGSLAIYDWWKNDFRGGGNERTRMVLANYALGMAVYLYSICCLFYKE